MSMGGWEKADAEKYEAEAADHTQHYVFEMLEDGLVELLTSLQTTKSRRTCLCTVAADRWWITECEY